MPKKIHEAEKPPAETAHKETIAMARDAVWGDPSTADVHPDEVENYTAGGWVVAE